MKALVPRSNAKECTELGIERDSYSVHHKCHIEQVMVHATTGFAFHGTPENGGEGIKISLDRCCCARVALKDQRASTRHADNSLHYDGELIRVKGSIYMKDSNVTGSNRGTSTKPKYALKDLWEHKLLKRIDAMVARDGPYPGYYVVLQQDGAGPHKEGDFSAYLNAEVASRPKWRRVDQGANGPYMNSLDAVVFPAMSKRHSKLLQQNNNTAVSKDKIMRTAEKVWEDLPSYIIARAFIQIYRLMKVVISSGGNNQWLSRGAPHLNVRGDFYKTKKGCAPKK
jgi:hypothetical protein